MYSSLSASSGRVHRAEGSLDQLLGYTSWRDTKTAVLVFNRNRTMSTVLNGIPEVVKKHGSYKADRTYDSETGFRYVFGHRDDANREMILTVLVFECAGMSAVASIETEQMKYCTKLREHRPGISDDLLRFCLYYPVHVDAHTFAGAAGVTTGRTLE